VRFSTWTEARVVFCHVRALFPEAYMVPGLGWCGPGWQRLTALWASIG